MFPGINYLILNQKALKVILQNYLKGMGEVRFTSIEFGGPYHSFDGVKVEFTTDAPTGQAGEDT